MIDEPVNLIRGRNFIKLKIASVKSRPNQRAARTECEAFPTFSSETQKGEADKREVKRCNLGH